MKNKKIPYLDVEVPPGKMKYMIFYCHWMIIILKQLSKIG